MSRSIFRSAITGSDGNVDAGYLGLFCVMIVVLGSIPCALTLTAIRMFMTQDHPLDLVGVAAIIGAAGACFGTAAGGVGLFRMGDKEKASNPGTTSTTTLQSADQTIRSEVVTQPGPK